MDNQYKKQIAREDFNKARNRARLSGILNALTPEKQSLLSLQDVRSLIKPKQETYIGMQVVKIDQIIGSEGRYQDFDQAFLPKREHMRHRWENVDRAYISDVILPPIKLYKIGDVYFVRDGNHRVSVAKLQNTYAIDAEVIELDSEIPLKQGMTHSDLRDAVIKYEKDRVFRKTELGKIMDPDSVNFSETGRFIELLKHIQGHKYFLNMDKEEEIPFLQAAESWYKTLYLPIIQIIRDENVLLRFPGRTEADLYMWTINHWDNLKSHTDHNYPLEDAILDFSSRFGKGIWSQIKDFLCQLVKRKK